MKAEQLRALLRARPFRPFEVISDSGDSYIVRHPEQLIVMGPIIWWTDGKSEWAVLWPEHVSQARSIRNGKRRQA